MKTILDKQIRDGLRVIVTEHEDAPGEYIINLERRGMKESTCSLEELQYVSGALSAAATRAKEIIDEIMARKSRL